MSDNITDRTKGRIQYTRPGTAFQSVYLTNKLNKVIFQTEIIKQEIDNNTIRYLVFTV